MKTRLILLIVVLITGKLLYDAGSPAPVEAAAAAGADHAVVGAGLSVLSRMAHGVGMYGAKLASPAVHEMVGEHASDLEEMGPAIKKAPLFRRKRALGVVTRIETLDSLALARLGTGQPIAALKYSMQSGGLMDAVRQNVLEETLIR